MHLILGFIFFLCFFSLVHSRQVLSPGELLHTKISMNYRIETLYDSSGKFTRHYFDVHSEKPILNPEYISLENVVEERFEDIENILVKKFDFSGNLQSTRAFKKKDGKMGEIALSDPQIRALERYDVEDEELEIRAIDWDRIVYADENFSRDHVIRWSDTRDFKIKTWYSRDGLVYRREVWNLHNGKRVEKDYKVYAQPVSKDVVQNYRGFMEIHYNTLGKVEAIRSWDRHTGKIVEPPRMIPFSSRLEQDQIHMNFEEGENFRKNFFLERTEGIKKEIQEGESLFPEQKRDYKLIEEIGFYFGMDTRNSGKIGRSLSGNYRDDSAQGLGFNFSAHPGKYRVFADFLSNSVQSRVQGDFQVKNLRFQTGADMRADFWSFDAYVARPVFTRSDAQIDLLGGLRLNSHDLELRDGSRFSEYNKVTLQPVLGYQLSWFVRERSQIQFRFLATKFHMGGVDTQGIRSSVEYRHKLPVSISTLLSGLDIGIGYKRSDYELRTDTDTLSPVGLDSFYRGGFFEARTRF